MSRVSVRTDRGKRDIGKHWSAKDRVKAVASWLVLGNMNKVEEATGIPAGTLHYWKTQPWWFEQVERIRQSEDQELDNQFTKIVQKTQAVVLDRLENGDFVYDKEGVLVRKPVSIRDAAIVSGISVDKRHILRQVPASEQNKIGMQERLKNLEMQFTKLVSREEKVIESTAHITEDTDGEVIEETEGRLEGRGSQGVESIREERG